MKQVVCLSTEPWSPTPGRTQHLITRLKDAQVLYFCPGGGLLDQRWRQPGRKVRPNVTVYTMPPALPVDERHDRLFRLSRQRQIRFLADKLARHRFRRPLLWTTSPVHIHALERWSTTVWSTTATRCGTSCPTGGRAVWLVRRTWSLPLPQGWPTASPRAAATSRCFPTG